MSQGTHKQQINKQNTKRNVKLKEDKNKKGRRERTNKKLNAKDDKNLDKKNLKECKIKRGNKGEM